MIQAYTFLVIDGEIINPKNYFDVQLFSSVDQTLPILTFKLDDAKGDYWNKLNFSIGSTVRVFYTDMSNLSKSKGVPEDAEVITSTSFCITKLFNGYEYNNSSMGGYIQVWCEQAWKYHKDFTPHAYSKMNMSSLIRTVCKSSANNKQTSLIYDSEFFEESSDSGSIRYKVATSDLDFLEKSIIPITLINSSNVLFYVNRTGEIHLSSFATLFNKEPKYLVHPNIYGQGYDDILQEVLQSRNLEGHFEYADLSTTIGSNSQSTSNIKDKLYLYNNYTGSTIIGNQVLNLSLGKNFGKIKKGITPVKKSICDFDSKPTSSVSFINRTYEDQVALSMNLLRSTNDLFSVEVVIGNLMPDISIGDTLYLWMPNMELKDLSKDESDPIPPKKKTHWLVGKWLIADEGIVTIQSNRVAVKLRLIRPTFYLNTSTTTLSEGNRNSFFQVL